MCVVLYIWVSFYYQIIIVQVQLDANVIGTPQKLINFLSLYGYMYNIIKLIIKLKILITTN